METLSTKTKRKVTRECQECGNTFTKWTGPGTILTRCHPCQKKISVQKRLATLGHTPRPKSPAPDPYTLRCETCRTPIRTHSIHHRYCSRECRSVAATKGKQCRGCGTDMTGVRYKHYCTQCRPETWKPKDLTCKDCQTTFEARDRFHARCPSCEHTRQAETCKSKTGKHRHRARHFNAAYESVNPATVYQRDGWRCGICNKKINPKLKYPHSKSASLDHITPLSRGGTHTYINCQAAHLECNINKGNRGAHQLRLFG